MDQARPQSLGAEAAGLLSAKETKSYHSLEGQADHNPRLTPVICQEADGEPSAGEMAGAGIDSRAAGKPGSAISDGRRCC